MVCAVLLEYEYCSCTPPDQQTQRRDDEIVFKDPETYNRKRPSRIMSKPTQSFSGSSSPTLDSRILSPSSADHSPPLSLRALELSESFPDENDNDDSNRPFRPRSNTVTSFAGFEFEHALLPLTLSGEAAESTGQNQGDERHVGLWHAIGLVVGMQVGSGIFSSPGVIVASVGSVGASLLVWVVSGLLAWTGAR